MSAQNRSAPAEPFADETTELLQSRLRIALLLCLLPIALFALFDLVLLPRDQLAEIYAIKLVAVGVALAAFAFLGPPRSRAAIVATGLTSAAVLYGLSSASAIMGREPTTSPILNIAVALGTATLLPWGVRPQIGVVLISIVASLVAVFGATGSLAPLLQYPTVGVAIGLGLSVYAAAEFERGRNALARRQRGQQQAEATVRQLNEVLEARVVERTTQLERLNRELQGSQAALTALIENANDAIWSIDRRYRVTVHNAVLAQRCEALFGRPLQLGPDADEHVLAHFREFWQPQYDRGLAGERFSIEHSVDTPDGQRHYVTFFNPIVSTGAVTGLAIFSSDVTERTQAEEAARRHQAELTHVLRLSTMGEMAAGLAHEINQPLAAIVNYAQGCARRLRADPHDVDAVLPVIDHVATEALRAGEIIRRMRTMVRKEAPRQDWLDLEDLSREALRLLDPERRQHQVAVRVRAEPDVPAVLGDAIQIEQVLLNLLRNAIEAMAAVRGRRELSVTITRLGQQAVQLAVCDSGPGLVPEEVERIFDPFFSTKPSGLGMGLSISRTIIEAHQGRLWAVANADGGLTFRFTLPLPAAPAVVTAAM